MRISCQHMMTRSSICHHELYDGGILYVLNEDTAAFENRLTHYKSSWSLLDGKVKECV